MSKTTTWENGMNLSIVKKNARGVTMQPVTGLYYQQGAIRLYQVLLTVIGIVGLVLLFKKGMIPGLNNLPTMESITNKLPKMSLNQPASTSTNIAVEQGVNVSVASAEGELINDEWVPPSGDDNEVYQDTTSYPTTTVIDEPAPPKPRASAPIEQQRPTRKATRTKPVKVANPPQEFPANLERGYYTIQVYAGYNSKMAYAVRRELEQDGYLVYMYELEETNGKLLRVRVGRYANLNSARAMRDQIRRRYPRQLSHSFVMMRQPN